MIVVAGIIGGLGLVCILSKKTVLGLLIGMQLLILGSTLMFVVGGVGFDRAIQGHIFGLFITLGGITQLGIGYSLALRLFYLKKKISLDELRALRQ
jgi:NADH:ubiquinone oxidoreductase subunit K